MNTSPIRPSPCRIARAPTLALTAPDFGLGRLAGSTINGMRPRARTCWCTRPSRCEEPLRIAGEPIAHLFASTSGSDSDWVVKIIDVWPDEVPERPTPRRLSSKCSRPTFSAVGIASTPAKPQPLAPNKALPYRIALPHASHTFLPGHRIMVQIQSSWFPLYDRNPQTFVPNIMYAKPESYVKATQRIWRAPGGASAIELPVIP